MKPTGVYESTVVRFWNPCVVQVSSAWEAETLSDPPLAVAVAVTVTVCAGAVGSPARRRIAVQLVPTQGVVLRTTVVEAVAWGPPFRMAVWPSNTWVVDVPAASVSVTETV